MFNKTKEALKVLKMIPRSRSFNKLLNAKNKEVIGSIGSRVEENAETYGERPALFFEDLTLNWSEFNGMANRYARALSSQGVTNGDTVALMIDNRPSMLAVIVALSKLGATAALINTNLVHHAITHCIEITNACKFIVGEEHLEAVAETLDELALDRDKDYFCIPDSGQGPLPAWCQNLDAMSQELDSTDVTPDRPISSLDTALYIYTSGTTGMPKAVAMSHWRFLLGAAAFHILGYLGKEDDRCYVVLPLYHSSGLMVGWGVSLWSGGATVLRRKFSASRFLEDIRRYKCNTFVYIGELCRYLMTTPKLPDDASNPLTCVVGNGLRPDIWAAFKERFGIERVCEFYGATEGVVVMINLFNKDRSIGCSGAEHMLIKYDVHEDEIVRDEQGHCIPVKAGEPGLLIAPITDVQVFEGYTNKDANDKRLVHNVTKDGDSWYNSGDMLKQIDVGFALGKAHYQFVDRIGDTFRWKGENVSTNDVGEVLNSHRQVTMSSVYGVKIPGTDGRAGMATLVLNEGEHELDLDEFSEFVNAELPSYARPIFLRIKADMPVTGTFKLVKGQLKEEGYDVQKIQDPIYVMHPGSNTYVRLDNIDEIYEEAAGF